MWPLTQVLGTSLYVDSQVDLTMDVSSISIRIPCIVGSLQSGLTGDHSMLYTKSMLDFISSIVLCASLGVGVILSAVTLFLYQGVITLLAQALAPILTDAVIAEMTCVGSLLIIGMGLNMLGVTKIKIMNYVPAIFIVIGLCFIM